MAEVSYVAFNANQYHEDTRTPRKTKKAVLRRFRRRTQILKFKSAKSAQSADLFCLSWCLCAFVVQICLECHAAHFGHASKSAESKKRVEREPRGSRVEEESGGDEDNCRTRTSHQVHLFEIDGPLRRSPFETRAKAPDRSKGEGTRPRTSQCGKGRCPRLSADGRHAQIDRSALS